MECIAITYYFYFFLITKMKIYFGNASSKKPLLISWKCKSACSIDLLIMAICIMYMWSKKGCVKHSYFNATQLRLIPMYRWLIHRNSTKRTAPQGTSLQYRNAVVVGAETGNTKTATYRNAAAMGSMNAA